MIKRKSKHEFLVTLVNNRNLTSEDISGIKFWCAEVFGPGGRHRGYRWRYGWTDINENFYFKSEQDALMFAMRWS